MDGDLGSVRFGWLVRWVGLGSIGLVGWFDGWFGWVGLGSVGWLVGRSVGLVWSGLVWSGLVWSHFIRRVG
jgi:hypothetical protein